MKRFKVSMNTWLRRLVCHCRGHQWSESLDQIPTSSLFHRIDCHRCRLAIDGVSLRQLRDQHPELWEVLGRQLP